jgi:signal peptidase I
MKEWGDEKMREEALEKERYYGVGSFLWEIIKVFVLAAVIITPIRVFLFQPFFVEGASMEPNFQDGNYLIINELGYKKTDVGSTSSPLFTIDPFKNFQRGDVIVFHYPKDETKYFIKRVVGLPGEKVKVNGGKVTIFNAENKEGFVLDESEYLDKGLLTTKDGFFSVLSDEYFVMGDNRPYSFDSRDWGPLKKDEIVGKVMMRAWPFGEAKFY